MKRLIFGVVVIAVATAVVLVVRGQGIPVEMTQVSSRTVREYVAEDAKTRLDNEYILTMPVAGTLERLELEVGDSVEQGQVVARVDPFILEQQIRGLEALLEQTAAQIEGVDVTKPKPEEIESAAMRVREAQDGERIVKEERAMAELQYAEAEKEYNRMRALHGQGAVSQANYDAAERLFKQLAHGRRRAALAEQAARKRREIAELNSRRVAGSIDDNEFQRKAFQAEADRLRAELAVMKDDLAKTEITAPVAGPILEKYVEDECVLAPGTPLLKIGDLASIEIECDVLSEEVGRVQVGDHVEIGGKALQGRTIQGTVSRIYPAGFRKISSLGIEQQRVRTIVSFDNGESNLRPGSSVDVRIITAEHPDALAVPERATFRREGQWYVFGVRNGRARLAPVTIGLKNDDWAEILDGLKAGDTIVAEPKNELTDGARVTQD